jgi:glycosyltransferase involved in cell wall biosynthesis
MKKIACVILPTYNEAQNVSILIPRIFEQASKIPTHELHILVVDDNSPDLQHDPSLLPLFVNLSNHGNI